MASWREWAVRFLVFVAAGAVFTAVAQANLETRILYAFMAGLVLIRCQCILGPMRRCTGHWFVQYGAMAAYYLPSALVAFISSAVLRVPGYFIVPSSLSCFVLMVLAAEGTTEMTAYAYSDAPPRRWPHFTSLVCLLYLIVSSLGMYHGRQQLYIVFCSLANAYLIVFNMQLIKPAAARMKVGDGMGRVNRIIGDAHMGAYHDVSLAYKYCRRLTSLHFGTGEDRAFDLPVDLQVDYERVFSIVGMQLGFLHDYFFTNYHSMIRSPPGGMLSVGTEILEVLQLICGVLASLTFLVAFGGPPLLELLRIFARLFVASLIWWIKMRPILPVYWRHILNAFQKYRADGGRAYRPSLIEGFLNCLSEPYWQNKIGQYSLIQDYDSRNYRKTCIAWFKEKLFSEEIPVFVHHHPEEEDPADLTERIKILVATEASDTIQNQARLTNGKRSLERNNRLLRLPDSADGCSSSSNSQPNKVINVSRTLGLKSQTILIWHIATCYCDMFELVKQVRDPDHEVATALSGYCAYLVAFLPELLPWDSKATMRALQTVLNEAQRTVSTTEEVDTWLQREWNKAKCRLGLTKMSMDEKKQKMEELELPAGVDEIPGTTFEMGVKLGKQLMQLRIQSRWTVMAEFWVETILYIAPSDKATAHVERLAQGGEFVTHLWAMLSNYGIHKENREE